ncbi:MAG: HprK-related kinase A [Betaproteobacteria bacterium]|nr:HprK-related kinase A [Betaproteobacteria bacterium]
MNLRIADLTRAELAQRLARGLDLATGPFRFRITSAEARVAEGLHGLYADFPVTEEAAPLRDFHVRVERVPGLRRWLRPQIRFMHDAHAPFKPLPAEHALASLEWGMNWCIASYAHHLLSLHAAVLEKNGRAVLLPGEPGAGKSTLTAALALSGWRLLSDEIALVRLEDGLLLPLARPVNLKNASIDIIRARFPEAVYGPLSRDTHKGAVIHLRPPGDAVARMAEPALPAWVVFPRWQAGAPARFKPRPRAGTFVYAAENSFNYSVLGETGFAALRGLIDRSECLDFSYGDLDHALAAFEGLVT